MEKVLTGGLQELGEQHAFYALICCLTPGCPSADQRQKGLFQFQSGAIGPTIGDTFASLQDAEQQATAHEQETGHSVRLTLF